MSIVWKTIRFAVVTAALLSLIGTAILRSVIHGHRAKKDGLGGTQDIAMRGTMIVWLFLLVAGVSALLWLLAG